MTLEHKFCYLGNNVEGSPLWGFQVIQLLTDINTGTHYVARAPELCLGIRFNDDMGFEQGIKLFHLTTLTGTWIVF